MILSVSRRTDIPAFYSPWFLNSLQREYVLVRNPVNPVQVGKVLLSPGTIDCIVFWTKNPQPLFSRLSEIEAYGYAYYFLYTITPYGPILEKSVPPLDERLATFTELARRLGKKRVIWRYDPIIFNPQMDIAFHLRWFEYIATRLSSYTQKCIMSFLDMYKKCERNLAGHAIHLPDETEIRETAAGLSHIAANHGIQPVSCAEHMDLSPQGIFPGKCIDEQLISEICGYPLDTRKDPHQRKDCLCAESVDIGAYNTCRHFCLYCYANADISTVQQNAGHHHPESPLLLGELAPGDQVRERPLHSLRCQQKNLFPPGY